MASLGLCQLGDGTKCDHLALVKSSEGTRKNETQHMARLLFPQEAGSWVGQRVRVCGQDTYNRGTHPGHCSGGMVPAMGPSCCRVEQGCN